MRFQGRKSELFRKAMIVLMGGAMIWSIVASMGIGRGGGRLEPGTEIPNAKLLLISPDGDADTHVELSDFRGKGVLLNFWATWCRPCVSELPLLQRLSDSFGGEHFQVVAVTDEDPETVRAFMRRSGIDFTVLQDPGGKLARKLRVRSIPYTAFLGPDLKVVDDHQGVLNASDAGRMAEKVSEAAKDYQSE